MEDTKAPLEENQEAGAKQGLAQELLKLGYPWIIPVIPPGATLAAGSAIALDARGKAPGRPNDEGKWFGFDWASAGAMTGPGAVKVDGWGANIGCRMGGQVVALDVDVLDPALAAQVEAWLKAEGVTAPKRVGRAPKALWLFARETGPGTAETFKGASTKRRRGDGTGDRQGLELLGAGKQAVVAGTHPGTGQPYDWYGADGVDLGQLPPAFSALPVLPDARLKDLYEGVLKQIEAAGYTEGPESHRTAGGGGGGGAGQLGTAAAQQDRDDLETVFSALPNEYDWDAWVRMGHALIGALGKTEETRELWTGFSRKFGAEDPQTTESRWDGFPEQADVTVGVGTILVEFDRAVASGKVTDVAALDARQRLRDRAEDRLWAIYAKKTPIMRSAATAREFMDAPSLPGGLCEGWDEDRMAAFRGGLDALAEGEEAPVRSADVAEWLQQWKDHRGPVEASQAAEERKVRGVGLPSDFRTDFALLDIPQGRAEARRYLAERFATINVGGKVAVVHFKPHEVAGKGLVPKFMSPDGFALFANRVVHWSGQDKTGAPTKKYGKAGSELLYWDHRPQFNEIGVWISRPAPRGALNLWQGWAVDPKPGDWSLIERHMLEVVCDGDLGHYRYLLAWCANAMQKPEQPGGVAVVMRGGEGTGKGFFARFMVSLAGAQGLHISDPERLTGRFSAHLRNCVMLFADEAVFAGAKSQNGKLKALLTEPTMVVEEKFLPAMDVPNHLHVIMASNEDWVIPAGLDARRFFVLDVSEGRKIDDAYFNALQPQIDGEGSAAFLHHLLWLDLEAFCKAHGLDLRRPPKTAALAEQKLLSADPHLKWWYSVLASGAVNSWEGDYPTSGPTGAWDRPWPEKIATKRLFALYEEFCDRNTRGIAQRRLTEAQFGKWLTKDLGLLGGGNTRGPRLPDGLPLREKEVYGRRELVRQNQAYCYYLPSVDACRKAFEALLGQTLEWDAPASGEDEEADSDEVQSRAGFGLLPEDPGKHEDDDDTSDIF